METILVLLLVVLFIMLIVGLVNPTIILKWSKKPTRLKVVGWYILTTIIVSILLGVFSQKEDKKSSSENSLSNKSNVQTAEDAKSPAKAIELKEEFPELQTKKIDVGRLKMHEDGYSIGTKTELTELQKQIKNEDVGIVEITWIWDCSPKYADMPMKLMYNKFEGVLQQIYTQNNVIEEYKNIMPECLLEFLEKGEKSFYSLEKYCIDANYDFNNREMTIKAVGEKPEQSEWDGSVDIVKKYIKENTKDASSIKFIEWSKVSPAGKNWVVRCKYNKKNAAGVVVTENRWFYIQNSQVINTKLIE